MIKRILIGAIVFFTCAASCLILTHGSLKAEGAGGSDVIAKLNAVLEGQREVAAAINSMKTDIQIIKIRVTQSQ